VGDQAHAPGSHQCAIRIQLAEEIAAFGDCPCQIPSMMRREARFAVALAVRTAMWRVFGGGSTSARTIATSISKSRASNSSSPVPSRSPRGGRAPFEPVPKRLALVMLAALVVVFRGHPFLFVRCI